MGEFALTKVDPNAAKQEQNKLWVGRVRKVTRIITKKVYSITWMDVSEDGTVTNANYKPDAVPLTNVIASFKFVEGHRMSSDLNTELLLLQNESQNKKEPIG